MAKKEVTNIFKIMATGGAATPAPPLGPVLGSKGVNPGQFVQKFNAATQHVKGKVVGCIVTVYSDRSFELEVRGSPVSAMIKDTLKLEKGSGVPNKNKVGKLTKAQVTDIAKTKMVDLNANSVEAAMRIVEGTARSMGVTVA
ncbi:MAG: 50S ribosomal protein L11 [Phycisphaerae bacterium]|jgi:large subunit ribosomal protein L11|nr:50S ribosomal protein L11 [Phycisphaerales bacterium]